MHRQPATVRCTRLAVAAVVIALAAPAGAQSVGVTSAKSTQTIVESPTGNAAPSSRVLVEVFANSDTVITGADAGRYAVQVFRVDTIRMLELELERGLPPTEAEALPVVRARIKAMGAMFAQRSQQGGAAVMAAQSYGLKSYPAMVFAGKAVVFGYTDVAAAARMFEAGRAQPIKARVNPTKFEAMSVGRGQP